MLIKLGPNGDSEWGLDYLKSCRDISGTDLQQDSFVKTLTDIIRSGLIGSFAWNAYLKMFPHLPEITRLFL